LISLYVVGSISLGFTAVFEPIANGFGLSYAQISLAASLRSGGGHGQVIIMEKVD